MHTHDRWPPLVLGLVLLGCVATPPAGVRPGIDVLLDDSLHLVRDRRVGLLTNQAGVDARGVDDVTRLLAAGVRLTALFSPEHGFRGQLDEENIGDTHDSATGIPIYSLYGRVRAPTRDMLADVDVLVVDLPDIGARTYTYVWSALLAFAAAAHHGVPVVVLDRPNPIGGTAVQGPVLDTAFRSRVGMLPVPLRHGMTLGELVRFGRTTLGLGGSLTVIPAEGWRRRQWLDEAALPWVRPSPSMPSLESAALYPGLVLFEATNLSVGRGTPIAFQVIGAPWLDPARVIRRVGSVRGVAMGDTTIVPSAPPDAKYPGVSVAAIRFRVTDRAALDPVELAVRVLAALRAEHPDSLRVTGTLDRLAGTDRLRMAIERGEDAGPLVAAWAAQAGAFRSVRMPFLLYPDELP